MRNLNGKEVGGRPLRIDLADSDPLLEGKSTSFGELLENDHKPVANNATESWLGELPPGVAVPPGKSSLDIITQAVATAKPDQILEALYDMKVGLTLIATIENDQLTRIAEFYNTTPRKSAYTSCGEPTIGFCDVTSSDHKWYGGS